MSFFEIPKLDIVLEREFPNILTDRIRSDPKKNENFVKIYNWFEERLGINHETRVREYSFKSHMHIPSNDPKFSYVNNDIGYFRFYDAESDKAVIVIPQRGSAYGWNFARVFASYLACNGFDVYEVVTPFHEKRLPDNIEKSVVELPIDTEWIKLTSKQAVEEILGLISVIKEQRHGIKLGVEGISQGAGYGTIVSGTVRSSVYVHGFGDLAGLLLYSDDKFARRFRELELKRKGSLDAALYYEELRDVDPLTYARNINPDNVVMLNARNDHSLPKRNIRALHEALGKPKLYWFGLPFAESLFQKVNGHFYMIARTKRVLEIALAHFRRTLK